MLLIWNTIRTAMFARRREIEVMKLVGATNWFIRIPFMLEGLVQGLVGGAAGVCGLYGVNYLWNGPGDPQDPRPRRAPGELVAVPPGRDPACSCVGMLVGAIGSAVAATRFLDV